MKLTFVNRRLKLNKKVGYLKIKEKIKQEHSNMVMLNILDNDFLKILCQ